MKAFIGSVALLALVAGGCQNKKQASISPDSSVADISPPSYTPSAEPMPVSVAPAMDVTPVASSGSSYTIKKGDTLYSIARSQYGDGKQYAKLVSANPGIDPRKLRVGQTITIP